MSDISKKFNRSEFSCQCGCGFKAVDHELLDILENIRGHFSAPITINSACRCLQHNESVGGSANSQHLYAMAADIVVYGVSSSIVADYLEMNFINCGIGRYDTFTHIDVRGYAARWKG